MSLSTEEVHKIAHLARLAMETEQLSAVAHDLSGILDLVNQMNAIDTCGTPAMAHPLDMVQRLRADVVTEPDVRDRCQAIAPLSDQGLYLVPKVIE